MLRLPFVVRGADVDERTLDGEAAPAYLPRVACAKLAVVREAWAGSAAGFLAADTVVIAPGGDILGKPAGDGEARAMIERLAGTCHDVSTCFVLAGPDPASPIAHAQTVTTRVTFRKLFPGEAQAYVAMGEGKDKAGAYALQGAASAFVERIEGSYTSVIGLPLCELVMAMQALGWI